MDAVLRIMAEHEYAADTIKSHQGILNSLMKYLAKNHCPMNESVGLAYIKERTGIEMEGLWGRGNRKINTILKPIQNLLYYLDEGDLTYFMRSKIKAFVCPPSFEYEYQLFQKEYRERHYADATIVCNNNIVNKLLTFLYDKGVGSSARITSFHLTDFLAGFVECKPKYISTVLYVMKNYLSFLKDMGIVKADLSAQLPHVRILRNAFIPHVWKTDDVRKLLASIDRSAAKGKRDFAILLVAARLGLRVGDIRNLRLSNLNWNRKIIALCMQKTGQPLELPINKLNHCNGDCKHCDYFVLSVP